MAIKLINRKIDVLTPDLANHLLSFNDYDSQRPIRMLHVEDLKTKIKNGLFRFGQIATASLNGERDRLMNGQHVCCAVAAAEETIDCVFEKFKCDTPLDMSKLFRQFEILPRSLKDFIRHEKEALGIPWSLHIATLVVGAAVLDRVNFKSYNPGGTDVTSRPKRGGQIYTKERKAMLLQEYRDEGNFINEILSHGGEYSDPKKTRFMQKVSVAFVMMETWRINVRDALRFWSSVRDGEMLKQNMPEMKYREFLLVSRSIRGAVPATNHEIIYKGHIAWNAYRKRKSTNLAYRVNLDPPALV